MKRLCKLMIFMIFRMINGLFIVLIWIVQNEKNIAVTQTENVSASKVAVEPDRSLFIGHFCLYSNMWSPPSENWSWKWLTNFYYK